MFNFGKKNNTLTETKFSGFMSDVTNNEINDSSELLKELIGSEVADGTRNERLTIWALQWLPDNSKVTVSFKDSNPVFTIQISDKIEIEQTSTDKVKKILNCLQTFSNSSIRIFRDLESVYSKEEIFEVTFDYFNDNEASLTFDEYCGGGVLRRSNFTEGDFERCWKKFLNADLTDFDE